MTLTLTFSACGVEPASTALGDAVVTDSAGIRVVANRIPTGGVPIWARVGPEPAVELGGPGTFGDVVGAASLADGTIAVADAANRRISLHSRDGEPLGVATLGGDPDWLSRPSGLGRTQDGFWVFDAATQSLAIVEGGEVRKISTGSAPGEPLGRFGDGSFLVRRPWTLALHRDDPRESVRRDSSVWRRWWPEQGDTASTGRFPYEEVLVVETDSVEVFGIPPFGRGTSVAVGPGRFWVGDQVAFEIRGYDPDGTPREIVRLEGIDLTLTPAQVDVARPAPPADGSAEPEWVERFWANVSDRRPAYTRFLLDDLGNLWVAEHVAVLDSPRNWLVFDAAGVLRGLVEVPPRFTPYEVARGRVLGVGEDPAGGPLVRSYAVTLER